MRRISLEPIPLPMGATGAYTSHMILFVTLLLRTNSVIALKLFASLGEYTCEERPVPSKVGRFTSKCDQH